MEVPTPVPVMLTSPGLVPDDAAPPVVEFGNGYGTEVGKTDDGIEGPVAKPDETDEPPVPALPVGTDEVAFGRGYGAVLVRIPVAPPVPDVRSPLVGKTQLLELENGNGGEVDELPGGPVRTPVPDGAGCPLGWPVLPVGPDVKLELLQGKGGKLVSDIGAPLPPVPVGPAVGPAAVEELLIGNGGDDMGTTELTEVPCMAVPGGAVPVGPGPWNRLEVLEKGKGAEIEPVTEFEMPVPGIPVPIPVPGMRGVVFGSGVILTVPEAGFVPVGPSEPVEELLNGNGAV
jgi:hypothetical protein